MEPIAKCRGALASPCSSAIDDDVPLGSPLRTGMSTEESTHTDNSHRGPSPNTVPLPADAEGHKEGDAHLQKAAQRRRVTFQQDDAPAVCLTGQPPVRTMEDVLTLQRRIEECIEELMTTEEMVEHLAGCGFPPVATRIGEEAVPDTAAPRPHGAAHRAVLSQPFRPTSPGAAESGQPHLL